MESIDWGDTSSSTGTKLNMKIPGECKPNYEQMIGDAKSQLAITQMFFEGCKSFILDGPHVVNRNGLKSLAGYLYIEIEQRKRVLNELMEQAEKEG